MLETFLRDPERNAAHVCMQSNISWIIEVMCNFLIHICSIYRTQANMNFMKSIRI